MKNEANADFFNKIIDEMSLEELIGQIMTFHVVTDKPVEEFEEMAKRIRPGGLFFGENATKEIIDKYTKIVNKYTKVPVIVSGDVENGPGCVLKDEAYLPRAMAWGACDDENLIEKAGRVTGEICRKNGIHWTFAPVVDINFN